MKHIKILFFIFIIPLFAQSQVLKPTKWEFTIEPQNPEVGTEAILYFNATIEENWYLYSSDFSPELGPMVTEFFFNANPSYELIEGIEPQNPLKAYDSIFEGEYTYFKKKAVFKQKVKILKDSFMIDGDISFQVCSDVDGKCIPFEEGFIFTNKTNSQTNSGENKNVVSFLSQRDSKDPYSLLFFMLISFMAGLVALLTPCMLPMIPMTVTFFTGADKKKKGKIFNSLIFGFFIILIYVSFGAILAPFMGPEVANELSTNWIPNVLFFLVFIFFALSFFGLFEITLPHQFVNKIDSLSDKKGIIGIFFMAFTLVLVSFSCTGPIVGSILVEAAGGLVVKPLLGMFAFAFAIALPFMLFSFFPHWVNSLPKSGAVANSVKIVLGFIELALSLKFLSIADQAYHWRILDREVFLALWIVIFGLLGFYLLGKINLPSEPEKKSTSVLGLMLSICVFSFVVYLIPGLFGAPLKSLAGYLPPLTSHDFNFKDLMKNQINLNSIENEICEEPKYGEFLKLPHGLNGYFDYQQALSCSKSIKKPIFIDFTGHGCVNCREMEAKVWSDEKVLSLLKKEFIVLALYVDDKTALPENEQFISTYDNKIKKSIGNQNADIQITKYNNNAQPFYVIIDEKGQLLVEPIAYNLNVENFLIFLNQGLRNYKSNTY